MKNLTLIIVLIIFGCSSEKEIEFEIPDAKTEFQKQLNDFVDKDWRKVYKAKDTLMMFQKTAIPHLIGLMKDRKRFVKLKNTADLIYPGATEYYGHGWYIPYDLDWIAIRAGWAFEELTFQNFGFIETQITEIDFIQMHKDNYEEYIQKGKHDVKFKRESFKELEKSIKKATDWWIKNQADWTNIKSIKEAIYSEDVTRQMNALGHLRYPNYQTDGLTNEFYQKELLPRIIELKSSKDEGVAEQARLKLREN